MGKEVVDISTGKESACAVIRPPNGNADYEEVVSGSHDKDSPEGKEAPHSVDSQMDDSGKEDIPEIQDLPKPVHQQESSEPDSPTHADIVGQQIYSHTVPEPCTITAERSSGTGNCAPVAHPTSSGEKLSDKSNISPRSMAKKGSSVTPRKPSQLDNTSHSQEEDSYSVTSSTVTSSRAGKTKKTTVPVAPTFVCANRAEKRGEFYTKLEEKRKALEEERLQAEARKKEEQEEALRQLRKNLVIRAKPMPTFYQEGPPPKVELKKVPPTRAKSPKLTRRKSCSDTPHTPEGGNGSTVCCRLHRHSIGNSKDVTSKAQCSPKGSPKTTAGSGTKSRTPKSREVLKAVTKNVGPSSAANVSVQT